jgi:hypothetical protein
LSPWEIQRQNKYLRPGFRAGQPVRRTPARKPCRPSRRADRRP